MSVSNRKSDEGHFAFGKNWASYANLIGDVQIEEAKKGLLKLIPSEQFKGHSFLDIGCGSGLHALVAADLGVSRILAVDVDPDSVRTTRAVLSRPGVKTSWQAEERSVFDLDPARQGTFDIVYSWGVLHHTGSMWEAIAKAAAMVSPQGLIAIALYQKTPMDSFWKLEKRLYSSSPSFVQRMLRSFYVAALSLRKRAGGSNLGEYIAQYKSARGMDFYHDVHDWLGGYPYETALASDVDARLQSLGFKVERVFCQPTTRGILGSGCDEYVYRLQR